MFKKLVKRILLELLKDEEIRRAVKSLIDEDHLVTIVKHRATGISFINERDRLKRSGRL